MSATVQYLKAPADGLWSWEEDDSILWCHGSTITFRQELLPLLEWQGLKTVPPFESVVLLLAALRGKVPSVDQLWRMRDPIEGDNQALYSVVQQELRRRIELTVEGLHRLRQLPRELLARPMAHRSLVELLSEVSESSAVELEPILETLRDPVESWSQLNPQTRGVADHIPAVHVLYKAFANLSKEQLVLRIETGCDRLLSPPEIDFATSIRKLLGSLVEDQELAALAKLARDVMAAIYIPRDLSEPETLPLGGAADISNRGSLDRLLLSELAHEDDVLAARLALNEALYLRREPPAQKTASCVAVLIDAGIRMWGTARLFGLAVALALGGRAPGRGGFAFVADGERLRVTDLLSREGLIRALGLVTCDVDLSGALSAFLAESSRVTNPQRALITHADALDDPDFRKVLLELKSPVLVATVNGDGDFALVSSDALNSRPLCHAHLDLNELTRTPAQRKVKSGQDKSPAIYSCKPFPLFLPLRGSVSYATPLSGGGFAILTNSHRLYLSKGKAVGARPILRELVPGKVVVMEYVASIDKVVLLTSAWRDGSIPLYLFDVEGREVRKLRVHVTCPPAAGWIEREHLFLYYRPRIDIVRIDSGELVQSLPVDLSLAWHHGRFFEMRISDDASGSMMTEWHVLVNQGLTWGFERLISAPNDVAEVFDRAKAEGPWVVRESGGIQALSSYRENAAPELISPVRIKAVSRDGERVQRADSSVLEIATNTLAGRVLEPNPEMALFTMRTRWRSIGVTASGEMLLAAVNNRSFILENTNWGLFLKEIANVKAAGAMRGFVPEADNDLKIAQWRPGLRAVLDSDGLLHLQCDAKPFVELTIGLCEGAVPVWLASGAVFGLKRFTGEESTNVDAEVRSQLHRFLTEVLAELT